MEKAWRVTKEFNEQRSEYQLMGKGLILEMLGLLLRSLEDGSDNTLPPALSQTAVRQQHLVNHAVYYLENHHSDEITLEQLAQQLFVSPAHLSKIFKEATGLSPIHYLIHVRLKHAKELLKQEEWTIKEVAQAVGQRAQSLWIDILRREAGDDQPGAGLLLHRRERLEQVFQTLVLGDRPKEQDDRPTRLHAELETTRGQLATVDPFETPAGKRWLMLGAAFIMVLGVFIFVGAENSAL